MGILVIYLSINLQKYLKNIYNFLLIWFSKNTSVKQEKNIKNEGRPSKKDPLRKGLCSKLLNHAFGE